MTRQTWLANLGGFVGVAIVLRPNLMALGPVAILPLVSALGMSMLVIGNRLSAGSGSALAMQFQLAAPAAFFLALTALAGHLSGVETLHVGAPQGVAILAGVVVAIVATAGHWCIYFGTTRAGAATIAPMTYVQIVCAGVLGWLLFGDVPDLLALVGVAIIVASGLFLWRGRQPVGVPDEAG
ncbi:DMT family transporter [Croceicoccus naphthovorans]|uniref:DMT family transporter n=1 Tax=Croceicoccus naphthovorans TaxID=1348774 RepID=UPI00069CF666|nr:DMT family transporter [Croceicoccus naphthovorans]MBB3991558.1 drug/metabolite transporter (DMT)-like permease [Croceicoccus naphthovorans]